MVAVPAFTAVKSAGEILRAGFTVRVKLFERVAPAVSVAFTVKVQVPGALGVPLSVTVPAAAIVVRFPAVRPVEPAVKASGWHCLVGTDHLPSVALVPGDRIRRRHEARLAAAGVAAYWPRADSRLWEEEGRRRGRSCVLEAA